MAATKRRQLTVEEAKVAANAYARAAMGEIVTHHAVDDPKIDEALRGVIVAALVTAWAEGFVTGRDGR